MVPSNETHIWIWVFWVYLAERHMLYVQECLCQEIQVNESTEDRYNR